jgi:hypothetical protein
LAEERVAEKVQAVLEEQLHGLFQQVVPVETEQLAQAVPVVEAEVLVVMEPMPATVQRVMEAQDWRQILLLVAHHL